MQQLIIINGTPGIGKTTVAKLLFARLKNCAYLCGDAVWQINPFEVNERTKAVVEKNIPFVLRSYLEAGYEFVILDWVMHRQEIIDRILRPLADLDFETKVFTLVADEQAAVERALARDGAARSPEGVLERLRQSRDLDSTQIDTTGHSPEAISDKIFDLLSPILPQL